MPWPSKYQEWIEHDGLLRLEAYARDGLTDVEIAKRVGISKSTLNEWKKKYPEIADSLKRGKEPVDIGVENSLLKRAMGFSYTEDTFERVYNKDTKEYEIVKTKSVTKMVVPDTTAQIFWLKNRKPDAWRNRQEETADPEVLNKAKELLGAIKSVIE